MWEQSGPRRFLDDERDRSGRLESGPVRKGSALSRAIWSGSISFGLVNVPVKVFTGDIQCISTRWKSGLELAFATRRFRTSTKESPVTTLTGLRNRPGRLVTVDPAQLAELRPRTSRTIDISDFVDLAEIDPVFYDHTYWLGPDGESARRPYDLVRAMHDRNRAGIGMVVMRNKQYLAAVRPREGALAMSTMHFADEVLDESSVENLSPKTANRPRGS